MGFSVLDDGTRLARLTPPAGPVDMVLDTDTYNEIDDQFAVVYSLLSRESVEVKAINAAPFHNKRSSGPGDGMEKSYEEILRVLSRMDVSPDGLVFKGSRSYLPGKDQPVESDAARHLIELARASDTPLYVAAVGAITNVASAILMDPGIIERIVVLWLGGTPWYWPTAREFNLQQDIPASQVIFDSGVPLVHFPCPLVTEQLRTTLPEMERYVKGKGAIGDYLYEIFEAYQPAGDRAYAWSKVIWDIIPIAWLVKSDMVPTDLIASPVLTDNGTWSVDRSRHLVREAYTVHRDMVFADFFRKLG